LQPIPALTQQTPVVSGKFVSFSRKDNSFGKSLVTPHIVIQEELEESGGGTVLEMPPAPDIPLQIVGPLTPAEFPENTTLESDPSDGVFVDVEEDLPVVIETPVTEDDETDEPNPFGDVFSW
jgi:hypothetical protein